MAREDSHNFIHGMNDRHEANESIGGLLKDPAMRAELQTPEQELAYAFFVDFMRDRNWDGIELTDSDVLESFRAAKHDTGYFMEQAEQPTSWQEAAEGLDDSPQREASQDRGMER